MYVSSADPTIASPAVPSSLDGPSWHAPDVHIRFIYPAEIFVIPLLLGNDTNDRVLASLVKTMQIG